MRRIAFASLFLVLAACSKDKEVNPPAELVDFRQTLAVERAWDASVGGGDAALRLGLGATVAGDRVYAAGSQRSRSQTVARSGRRRPKRPWLAARGPTRRWLWLARVKAK